MLQNMEAQFVESVFEWKSTKNSTTSPKQTLKDLG